MGACGDRGLMGSIAQPHVMVECCEHQDLVVGLPGR